MLSYMTHRIALYDIIKFDPYDYWFNPIKHSNLTHISYHIALYISNNYPIWQFTLHYMTSLTLTHKPYHLALWNISNWPIWHMILHCISLEMNLYDVKYCTLCQLSHMTYHSTLYIAVNSLICYADCTIWHY